MMNLSDLETLANKYGYNQNHNLRYLTLARLVRCYGIKELLILGCGKGILEYILPDDVCCNSIDINGKEVELAREINSAKKQRTFFTGDIFNLPRSLRRKFPAVIISEVLEHLKDDRAVVDLVHKLLNSDGLFILTVPNVDRFINRICPLIGRQIQFMSDDHVREYTSNDILSILSSQGFGCMHTEYVYFRFPKEERWIRKVVTLDGLFRTLLLKLCPKWGTYIVTVSSPS